jgi:predicted DCC family thiol-disulfide oxidoreductase YuxK
MEGKSPGPVLLYDGDCGLCNAVVRRLLRHDRRGVLVFAPLQGRTAQEFLRGRGLNTGDFDSLVFVADLSREDSPYWLRSAGALSACMEIGGFCRRIARVLRFLPSSWLDVVYRLVARSRYRLFGRHRPTPLPRPEWARRILD